MATASSSSGGSGADGLFNEFYSEVKQIEKRDAVLTPKQQIDRLLRPGSTYFNLNPFEVLQVEPDASLDAIKTKYKRLSILVHPDKNQDDKDRAQTAFEAVSRAWKTLEDDETRAKCLDVVEEAKAKIDANIAEKKKKMKRDGKKSKVEEEDPEKYKHALYVMTMKLFADMERKRRNQEERDMEDRKRKREEEIEAEEKAKLEKEWQKNYEESREDRVTSWKQFQTGGKKKKSGEGSGSGGGGGGASSEHKPKKIKTFRPPKHKAETR